MEDLQIEEERGGLGGGNVRRLVVGAVEGTEDAVVDEGHLGCVEAGGVVGLNGGC